MKRKTLAATAIALLSACGPSQQQNAATPAAPATDTAKPAAQSGAAKTDTPKINGLYIGMDIHDAPNAMMTILADHQLSGFGFTGAVRASDGTQCALMYTKDFLHAIETRMRDRYGEARGAAKVDEELLTSCLNSDGVLSVIAGQDGFVKRIEFNDVRDLFDAKGLPPAAFVQKLATQYRLPGMKPNEMQNVWSFVSPDGVKVEVDAKEVLGIPMARLYMSRAAP
jgi:hypothetical protein